MHDVKSWLLKVTWVMKMDLIEIYLRTMISHKCIPTQSTLIMATYRTW